MSKLGDWTITPTTLYFQGLVAICEYNFSDGDGIKGELSVELPPKIMEKLIAELTAELLALLDGRFP